MTSDRNPSFSCPRHSPEAQMKVNGLIVEFNMPLALRQEFVGNKEVAHQLPPYNPRKAFVVDEYPACPPSWMRGSDMEASYFVATLPEHGVWLDLNTNENHTHHVAVLISIQGVNATTGQKAQGFSLEQYRKECPVHKIPFGHERFCEKCGYQWNPQNYLATTGTPRGSFWLDGFWASDGVTRQFVLTEDKIRGIAAQVIGAERVFSLGIAFFLSKQPKPKPIEPLIRRTDPEIFGALLSSHIPVKKSTPFIKGRPPVTFMTEGGPMKACRSPLPDSVEELSVTNAKMGGDEIFKADLGADMAEADLGGSVVDSVEYVSDDTLDDTLLDSDLLECGEESVETLEAPSEVVRGELRTTRPVEAKKLEIGAGARIDQKVYMDPQDLSFWQERPAGIVYIQYTDEESALRIIKAGRRDLTAGGEGPLKSLNVGHPFSEKK